MYWACRDRRTPWYAKALALLTVAYAASPLDLIPDFIPVLGYLDDLLLVPLGMWVVSRLIPREVMGDCRSRAQEAPDNVGRWSWLGAVLVCLVWLAITGLMVRALTTALSSGDG